MSQNLDMVALVARRLGDLSGEVVFLGGDVTALLITDSTAPEVRFTADVDVIVDLTTHADYARLSERLPGWDSRRTCPRGRPTADGP